MMEASFLTSMSGPEPAEESSGAMTARTHRERLARRLRQRQQPRERQRDLHIRLDMADEDDAGIRVEGRIVEQPDLIVVGIPRQHDKALQRELRFLDLFPRDAQFVEVCVRVFAPARNQFLVADPLERKIHRHVRTPPRISAALPPAHDDARQPNPCHPVAIIPSKACEVKRGTEWRRDEPAALSRTAGRGTRGLDYAKAAQESLRTI